MNELDCLRSIVASATALASTTAYTPPSGITGGAQYDASLSLYNAKAANLRRWRTAFAAQKAGTARAHIHCVGDSVTQGYYATNPFYQNSWVDRLRSHVEAWTGVTTGTGIVSVSDIALAAGTEETRLSHSGTVFFARGYANSACRKISGVGQYVQLAATAADTVVVYYLNFPGAAFLQILEDDVQKFNGNTNATEAVVSGGYTVSGGVGSGPHDYQAAYVNGDAYVLGIEARIGAETSGVKVSRLGASGRRWQDIFDTTNPGSSLNYLTATHVGADLTVFTLAINDADTGSDIATMKSSMATVVAALQAAGSDVLLVVPPQPNPSQTPTWTPYRQALYDQAAVLGCALLDLTDRWGGYYATMMQDAYHPNNLGHVDIAQAVFETIQAIR